MAQIDKEYHKILQRILDEGVEKTDRTGTGTISVFDHTLRYDMRNGFPLLTTKKMFTKGVITELLWFLNGSTKLRDLVLQGNNIWVGDAYKRYYSDNVHVIGENPTTLSKEEFIERIKTDDEFDRKWGDLGPIYGKQWVNWTSYREYKLETPTIGTTPINQVQNVIETLKTNPDSRRIIVSAWNVGELDRMILPPCHWAYEFYTEELTLDEQIKWLKENDKFDPYEDYKLVLEDAPKRRLSLKWHQRSCDSFLGIPFNIASYGFLLEMVAQQVNMVPHMLIGDLTNVHVYKNHIDQVNKQLGRDVSKYSPPRLKLNRADDIFSYKLEDFEIENYESYGKITAPLSN